MIGIVRRTAAVTTFVATLALALTAPQTRNVERVVDLIIMAPRRKTLAELARQELGCIDAGNLADFFRISPWDPDNVRLLLAEWTLRDLVYRMKNSKRPILLTIDDSLTVKDKGTCKLQAVDWHHDHNGRRMVKAGCHVVLRIHWGDFHYPLLWRLYLRASTVRKLNRTADSHARLRYHSKLALAQQMMEQIYPLLPAEHPVYVLFDSWYTSAKLVKWIRQRGWHVIAGLKCNRLLSGRKLTDWHKDSKGRRRRRVRVRLANGRMQTCFVRTVTGRLRGVPGEVRVLMSQLEARAKCPKYFVCTDLSLSEHEILKLYRSRWSQEVEYWHVKQQLGLGDFRLHSVKATEKWYAVVYLTLTFLYWQKYEKGEDVQRAVSLSEVLRQIREDHLRATLRAACSAVAAGASVDEVVARFTAEPRREAG